MEHIILKKYKIIVINIIYSHSLNFISCLITNVGCLIILYLNNVDMKSLVECNVYFGSIYSV